MPLMPGAILLRVRFTQDGMISEDGQSVATGKARLKRWEGFAIEHVVEENMNLGASLVFRLLFPQTHDGSTTVRIEAASFRNVVDLRRTY